ncbi:YobI family P-loop NTPase [Parasphingorhabdus sp.]|uniref:YobI family P-loop NTPase n=1 Tax=Parasphingorhabdus sp. TaxID=2709688 RepID=UPI0030014E89
MKEHITTLAHWFSGQLYSFAALMESTGRPTVTQSKFVDLAPTDQADKSGVYSEALLYATNNTKVSNIALTGPYGSGKSSIIRSFLKRYRRPALHISLAAFVPEVDAVGGKVSRQEIERSILQQMLYGADANKLPLSRFKRIQSPGVWSIFKSLYIMLGLLALWYVFLQRDDIFSGTFFIPLALSNWFDLGSLALAALFLWMTLHHFYVASFGVSLKSISLKDVEIRPASDNQESILNRHLDEIVYFFQSTDYDLVIIEDLDRFKNTEIFVTLREINSLVNENAGVKRKVKFLYALRDDIFVNTDRTKFFEFIIPVIPIINTSNSIDMVLKQEKRLALDGRLDRQFLREVSRYLNDLRLIQNIFNEYAIYVANLETDDENFLNANKLLAILIYKNVYPRDFEQLHRGEGNLADILKRQEELIAHGEAEHRSGISELENKIETAEQQIPSDLKELRQIYAMALVEKLPANVLGVSLSGQTWITLPKLVGDDEFEQLIEARIINYRNIQNQHQSLDISSLQNDVDPQKSYLQRKAEIENKAAANKKVSVSRIQELRSSIATLRATKFNELVRLNADCMEDLFDGFGEKGELARFLILEGHLDDTYYQYTSLFHSGRLSPNDNKFLIQIRAFIEPEPDFPIDNPKEVAAAMRDEDFRQSYVLNVKLVDCLLSDQNRYDDQTQKLFEYISSEFESCEGFFAAYYAGGREIPALLSGLVSVWNKFVPEAIASSRNMSHITQLVANLSERSLVTLANEFDELSEFVSANLPEILTHAPELPPERLQCLGFQVKDFAAIKEHPGIIRVMFENGLFELTIANLEYAYQEILGENELEPMHTKNYTTLRSMNNPVLIERVQRDFDLYLQDVLLELPRNSSEGAPAILAILRRDDLDEDDVREFLGRQATLLPTLEDVPEKLRAMLFQLNVIEPTWANCLAFMEGEGFEAESLIDYLDRDDVRTAILKHAIPGDTDMQPLRRFLFEAAKLRDVAYQEYAQALPKPFTKFPEDLERTKLQILIEEGKVTFTKDSLDALAEDADLQAFFVAANIETYLSDPDLFALDDDFLEKLLRAEIADDDKRAIIDLMALSALADLPERAAIIGPILDRADANISDLDAIIVQSLIAHSRPIETQISLFNKCNSLLSDNDVRQVLANLPRPFSEIKTGYNTPRLTNSAENLALVKWLDQRKIISSWSESRFFTDDIRVNLYRR